jgi:hypothetical protein
LQGSFLLWCVKIFWKVFEECLLYGFVLWLKNITIVCSPSWVESVVALHSIAMLTRIADCKILLPCCLHNYHLNTTSTTATLTFPCCLYLHCYHISPISAYSSCRSLCWKLLKSRNFDECREKFILKKKIVTCFTSFFKIMLLLVF